MAECAFCLQHAKLTGEHIWSDWICELFPDIRVTFRKQFAGDAAAKLWEQDCMDLKTKVVCGPCNYGWMSDLESQHAAPAMKSLILSDTLTTLNREHLISIALFAFKSAVIGDIMQPKRPLVFSSLTRQRFARTLAIPQGCQVWIGCIGEEDLHHGVCRMRRWHTPSGIPNGHHIYGFTWGIGRFIFQLTHTRWNSGKLRRTMIPHLTQDHHWNSFSIPIWSANGVPVSVKWPPSGHLRDDVLNEFSDRWRRISVPAIRLA